jgi:nucleotide-binding universal stress UspA family protein
MIRSEQNLPSGAVVVGFDETPVAGRALDWAADVAVREGRPLAVVHATGSLGTTGTTWLNLVDPATEPTLLDLEKHGQSVLARAIARVGLRHPALSVVPVMAMEDPAPELLHLSRTAHLLVVGSRGHGVSRSVPSGQVGTWLARRTACPVVVVPDFNPATVRQGVLVGVPTAPHALAVLDFACHHASVHDLPLSVVHAAKGTPGSDDDRRRWLAEAMGGMVERYPDVRIHAVLHPGRPAGTLLRMADRMHLLVVGQHQATGLRRSPFDRVRSSIVDRSPCPTAVVPARVTEPACPVGGPRCA